MATLTVHLVNDSLEEIDIPVQSGITMEEFAMEICGCFDWDAWNTERFTLRQRGRTFKGNSAVEARQSLEMWGLDDREPVFVWLSQAQDMQKNTELCFDKIGIDSEELSIAEEPCVEDFWRSPVEEIDELPNLDSDVDEDIVIDDDHVKPNRNIDKDQNNAWGKRAVLTTSRNVNHNLVLKGQRIKPSFWANMLSALNLGVRKANASLTWFEVNDADDDTADAVTEFARAHGVHTLSFHRWRDNCYSDKRCGPKSATLRRAAITERNRYVLPNGVTAASASIMLILLLTLIARITAYILR